MWPGREKSVAENPFLGTWLRSKTVLAPLAICASCAGQRPSGQLSSPIMNTLKKISPKYLAAVAFVVAALVAAGSLLSGQTQAPAGNDRLMVYGDTVLFLGPGLPLSCTHKSQFKRGDAIGFRMTAINPATGKRDRATQLVVHLIYAGQTIDVPMRDRQNAQAPEREFWVGKWIVPSDAKTGIVRYSVTAKDPQGRTGEYKPFEVEPSQLTIVE
jgi:hypothetical protein